VTDRSRLLGRQCTAACLGRRRRSVLEKSSFCDALLTGASFPPCPSAFLAGEALPSRQAVGGQLAAELLPPVARTAVRSCAASSRAERSPPSAEPADERPSPLQVASNDGHTPALRPLLDRGRATLHHGRWRRAGRGGPGPRARQAASSVRLSLDCLVTNGLRHCLPSADRSGASCVHFPCDRAAACASSTRPTWSRSTRLGVWRCSGARRPPRPRRVQRPRSWIHDG